MEKHFHYDQFYTLREHPVFMCTQTKAGCTFLKNLFYYIDHKELHPLGDFIHRDEKNLLRASEIDLPIIKKSPYAFVVLRDPVDRFLSLYYEKIYGTEPGSMSWFRQEIGEAIKMDFSPDITLKKHQNNIEKLIRWVKQNLSGKTNHEVDFHWMRQQGKWRRVSGFKPKILLLEDINRQLPHLLSPIIPDIADHMIAVKSRNSSSKPFSFAETKTDKLVELVHKAYPQDVKMVEDARVYWKEVFDNEG